MAFFYYIDNSWNHLLLNPYTLKYSIIYPLDFKDTTGETARESLEATSKIFLFREKLIYLHVHEFSPVPLNQQIWPAQWVELYSTSINGNEKCAFDISESLKLQIISFSLNSLKKINVSGKD